MADAESPGIVRRVRALRLVMGLDASSGSFRGVALIAIAILWLQSPFGSPYARGQVFEHAGAGTNYVWGDIGNWISGVVPNSSSAVATFLPGEGFRVVQLNGDFELLGLTIDNSGFDTSISPGSGGSLRFGSEGPTSGLTITGSNNFSTISGNIVLDIDSPNSGFEIRQNSTGFLMIEGSILEADGADPQNITKIGTGELSLLGNNSFTGTFTHVEGTLGIGSVTALGTSALNIDGATGERTVYASAGAVTIANNVHMASDFSVKDSGLTFGGTFTIAEDDLNLTVEEFGETTISGVLAGSPTTFTKLGGGTLILSGTSTLPSTATIVIGGLVVEEEVISGGTLVVNNSGAGEASITVKNLSRLGGTGVVEHATVESGGALAPGVDSGTGTITFVSGLTLQADAKLELDLFHSVDTDLIRVTGGTVSNAGTVEVLVSNLGGLEPLTSYDIIDFSGATGALNAANFVLIGDTTGNYFSVVGSVLVLNVVPEPATWAMIALGAGACVWQTARIRKTRARRIKLTPKPIV